MHNKAGRILKHLRKDARISLAAIAREERLAVSTVFNHVLKLEEEAIIRYVPLFKPGALARPFRSILYSTTGNEELRRRLEQEEALNNLYRLRQGIAADLLFASMKEESELTDWLHEHGYTWELHRILEPLGEEMMTPQGRHEGED